jgi:hypothetical protein
MTESVLLITGKRETEDSGLARVLSCLRMAALGEASLCGDKRIMSKYLSPSRILEECEHFYLAGRSSSIE